MAVMTGPTVPENLDLVTPGKLVDIAWALREKRKLLETRAGLIEEEEKRIKEHLLTRLKKNELKGLLGKLAKCSITETIIPHVKDWDAVNKYIEENEAWDLRNKAANAAAFRARWEDGIVIPGVEKFKQVKINISQLPKKR